MDTTWRPLCRASLPPSCPKFFAKYQFASNSYVVFLTDLSHVWKEAMDRKNIFKRALLEETPIDPTEDAEQMQLLLKHIRSALDAEKGTRRQLIRNAKDPRAPSLHLTAALPGSLGDLQWVINFESLPPAFLQYHLISPLISKVYDQIQQVDDLIGQLNAKDHVISKLLDKLEGSGMDIASVFPGAAGSRGSKGLTLREQAARQVNGLGVFSSQEWHRRHSPSRVLELPAEKLTEVLRVPALDEDIETEYAASQWLSALPSTVTSDVNNGRETTNRTSDGEGDVTVDEDASVAEDDIFERQETPPRLKKSRAQQRPALTEKPKDHSHPAASYQDEQETTDDEDLDAPSNQPLRRPQTVTKPTSSPVIEPRKDVSVPSLKPKGLGRLGGRSSRQPSEKRPAKEPDTDEGAPTASETEDEDNVGARSPSAPAVKPDTGIIEQRIQRKGKLGVLGRKKAQASANYSTSLTPAYQPPPEPVLSSNRISSKIGGKATDNSSIEPSTGLMGPSAALTSESPAHENYSTAGQATMTTPPTLQPESERERANRKREELKRQLAKSQSPKKKRKF